MPVYTPLTTGHLRAAHAAGNFSFGRQGSPLTLCLVGSCRITPLLNYFRAVLELNPAQPFEILCLNPVEMRHTSLVPPYDDDVARLTANLDLSGVDILIHEHVETYGACNTDPAQPFNLFRTLGCAAPLQVRIPNWHAMFIYDYDLARVSPEYRALGHDDRVLELRALSARCEERFLRYCRESGIPQIADWVSRVWRSRRLGHDAGHVTRSLSTEIFLDVFDRLPLDLPHDLFEHPAWLLDQYAADAVPITPVDRDANGWEYS